MRNNYLDSALKQFEYYKSVGEKTFRQLDEKDLFWQYNQDSNSIAIIVNHLWGNMKSRWTDFLSTDGEKEWRNRDDEFVDTYKSKEELLENWNKGWNCIFEAINPLKPPGPLTVPVPL